MQDPAATHAATVAIGNAPVSGAVLHVRQWAAGELSGGNSATGKNATPAVCLASDLIAASGGVINEIRGQVFTARFSSLQLGVLAARRLQWAAQGFAETEHLREMAVTVLIQLGEDALGPMEDEFFPQALVQAAPGRILLTDKASKQLEEMTGFSLGAKTNGGYRELLWRAPEDRATPSFDETAIARLIEQKGPETYAQAYPVIPAIKASAASSVPEGGNRVARKEFEGAVLRDSSSTAPFSKQKFWMIGGAVAAVLLLAAVSFFHFSGGKASPTASTPATADRGGASVIGVSGPSVSSAPESTPQGTPSKTAFQATTQKQAKDLRHQDQTKSDQAKSKAEKQDIKEEPQKVAEVVQKPPVQAKGRCDLDQNQLGGQIEQAETSLARGRYKDAQRQFNSVLACEPGNARAQEGINRVHMAQSAENSTSEN